MANWITYTNQGATRSQPINAKLMEAMSFLPDLGVTMNVYSGGQDAEGPNRVGSTRHDHGNAADVMFYKDGRMLDWNKPEDVPVLSDIVARAKSRGVTGIGAGDDYMGAGRVHIGFGAPAVWGADGRSANAPEWLVSAYNGLPAKSPAVGAVNKVAAMAPTGPVAPLPSSPQSGGGFWSNPLAMVRKAASGFAGPIMASASSPQVQQAAIGPIMSSLAGRSMLMRGLMNRNIGPAPSVTQGHNGQGSRAVAVSRNGSAPVTLGSSGSGSSGSGPNGHMDMGIYRANAAVLGGGGFNQDNINKAIATGATLFKPA